MTQVQGLSAVVQLYVVPAFKDLVDGLAGARISGLMFASNPLSTLLDLAVLVTRLSFFTSRSAESHEVLLGCFYLNR